MEEQTKEGDIKIEHTTEPEKVQVGDIVIESSVLSANDIAGLIKGLLEDKCIKEYLDVIKLDKHKKRLGIG